MNGPGKGRTFARPQLFEAPRDILGVAVFQIHTAAFLRIAAPQFSQISIEKSFFRPINFTVLYNILFICYYLYQFYICIL